MNGALKLLVLVAPAGPCDEPGIAVVADADVFARAEVDVGAAADKTGANCCCSCPGCCATAFLASNNAINPFAQPPMSKSGVFGWKRMELIGAGGDNSATGTVGREASHINAVAAHRRRGACAVPSSLDKPPLAPARPCRCS